MTAPPVPPAEADAVVMVRGGRGPRERRAIAQAAEAAEVIALSRRGGQRAASRVGGKGYGVTRGRRGRGPPLLLLLMLCG